MKFFVLILCLITVKSTFLPNITKKEMVELKDEWKDLSKYMSLEMVKSPISFIQSLSNLDMNKFFSAFSNTS